MTAFLFAQKVLFKHCDPAGIVFFPRYFEMMNDCVEAFFDQALGVPFETLLLAGGVPTAAIETRFTAPSRHGDLLELRLNTKQVGGASWRYAMAGYCTDELRFETEATLVHVNADGRPRAWPDALREKLERYEAANEP